MTKLEDALVWSLWWTLSFFGALTIVTGKLARSLFGMAEVPPEDPILAAHWRLKRRWLAISEISAVPAFATIGVVATAYWKLPAYSSVPIAMVLGALGFGFLLNGVKFLAKDALRRKTGGVE